ncbi:unnamed protein product [Discula destructiva]
MPDTMRAALVKGCKLTPRELDNLNFVLDMMLDNKGPKPAARINKESTTFAALHNARVDKLLVDMTEAHDRETITVSIGGNKIEVGSGSAIDTVTDLTEARAVKVQVNIVSEVYTLRLTPERLPNHEPLN